MRVRGVVLVTIALFVGIAALVLHLLAMCSPHWKITKRDRPPVMAPVSYGLWQRCEYLNHTITKQGISVGPRANIQICWPNLYMRYSPDKYSSCYSIRRQCAAMDNAHLPEGCSCRYLPSAKALQWLTILAAVFLILGLLILYLKTIASPQNDSAQLVLSYGPFIAFLLALLLMGTGLILIGAYLRRDTYEDYSFPLDSVSNDTQSKSHDLYSLQIYAKHYALSHEIYTKAKEELINDANTHYHTNIGWATGYEIIATTLVFIITALSFWLGLTSKSEDI